jgi:hypothetical protein
MVPYFDGLETVLEGLVRCARGQWERKGVDCLIFLTGLRCANVLDRLEELEATFEGF